MADGYTFRPVIVGVLDRPARRGDTVTMRAYYGRGGDIPWGVVRRVAKDGSWADVFWGGWSKRHPDPARYLVVLDH